MEWRCTKCGGLLGVHKNEAIYVRHKKAQLIIKGAVMVVCPVCSEFNEALSKAA